MVDPALLAAHDIEDQAEQLELQSTEEDAYDEQISFIINQMNQLNAAIMQEKHANRMLAVDEQWLAAHKEL